MDSIDRGQTMSYPTIEEILKMPAAEAQKIAVELAEGRQDRYAGPIIGLKSGEFKALRMYLGIFKDSAGHVSKIVEEGRDWWGKLAVKDLNASTAAGRTWYRNAMYGGRRNLRKAALQAAVPTEVAVPAASAVELVEKEAPPVEYVPVDEFFVSVRGTYSGKRLTNLIERVQLILEDEEQYAVTLSLRSKEVKEDEGQPR